MRIEEEISALREALEPLIRAHGRAIVTSDDQQFAAHLRDCLKTLVAGKHRAGFDCATTALSDGDYLATLVWSAEAGSRQRKTSVGFTARGPTDTVAFLRVALKALTHPEYRNPDGCAESRGHEE
jgi:hypothetical protein